MHILLAAALITAAIVVLLAGLFGVLHALLEENPNAVPLLEDDGLNWPRHPGAQAAPTRANPGESRYATPSGWDAERDDGAH